MLIARIIGNSDGGHMNRLMIMSISALLMSTLAHADLAQDLRQLSNTISETSRAGKEVSHLIGGDQMQRNANANTGNTASAEISEGAILIGKIGNIKLYSEPNKKALSSGTLTRHEELVYTGTEINGFYSVATASKGEGWVEKVLVKKR